MATIHKIDSSKISDPELLKFAGQDTASKVSVIVELSIEHAPIELADPDPNSGLVRPYEALPIDEAAECQRMDRLERELKKLVTSETVRLDTAQAFVVDLTPSQLRAVLRLTDVGCVRPNRTHHTGHNQ